MLSGHNAERNSQGRYSRRISSPRWEQRAKKMVEDRSCKLDCCSPSSANIIFDNASKR